MVEGSFDAVILRVGFIYFPDQGAAFRGHAPCIETGRAARRVVYSTPAANQFFWIPASIIRRRAALPAPLPGQPGPFSFGTLAVIEAAYELAGFSDIEVRRDNAPLRMRSATECVRFQRESFGAPHQMMAGLSESEREDAWSEVEHELAQFDTSDGFEGPCELIVSVGRAS
ncbi:MAG TPA: hypothetical protein VEF89_06220 [Solirubrobacteraceae bacterium]|nr:hypothetical protein [Solirubrobacteraceae bacterium]